MKQAIEEYLLSVRNLCPKISEEELIFFEGGLSLSEIPNKHFYIQAGEIQKQLGYVVKGLIRAFYIDDKGNDITVNFIKEKNFASHYTVFGSEKPSKFFFQCIENTTIVNISKEHLEKTTIIYPSFERYARLVIEQAHAELLERMQGFLFGNAETRYLDFIRDNTDLFQRVPMSQLCSYLGIERQHLTRIRKKLLQHNLKIGTNVSISS